MSCRKLSGGTNSVNLLLPEDKIRISAGSAKQYTQIHENGLKLTINFCDNCGCVIYKTHESFPGSVVALAGTLDEPDGLEQAKPDMELWTKHRVSWLSSLQGAEQKLEF